MATREKATEHVAKVQKMMKDLINHLRADIKEIDNPQERAIFETSAEVLKGLVQTLEDYQTKDEPAWTY